MDYKCTMCVYTTQQHANFCNHIVRVHKHDARFMVFCQIGECSFSTKKWNSYKVHISNQHKAVSLQEIITNNASDDENESDEETIETENVTDPRALGAAYLLLLETNLGLSQTAVNTVAEHTNALIKGHLQMFRNNLQDQMKLKGYQNTEDILTTIDFESSLENLSTEHKRVKFYESEFKMILPQAVLLGHHLKKSKGGVNRVKDVGYMVPFDELVRSLHCLPEFVYWLEHHHEAQEDFMRDVCDGDYVRKHSLFRRNKQALQIVLYNDDIEIVNPLGTHVKKHKITLFYVTFANIPPEYRSRLPSIFLLAIAKSQCLKRHGISKLLNNFIETVNSMSSGGLHISANGNDFTVEGAVVMAPADTPASNCLGGFKEGVGFAHKKCRTCLISAQEMSTQFRDDDFRERTVSDYVESCRVLESSTLSREAKCYWSKMWGINGKTCLSDLNDFDIISCLVHDPMHVLLEGVFPYELALFLNYCIETKKYFKLAWLNAKLVSFPYSYSTRNSKPEPIERKHYFVDIYIKQTAAAMLTLINILPVILGPKVPSGNLEWVTLLKLVQITQITLTPCVSKETTQDLRNLIESHHCSFVNAYPKARITPKMHYICHLPKQLQTFGPGKCQWCMRFEAKHAFFKNKKWRCLKNLPLSMAKFHQKWLCRQMVTSTGEFSENFLYSGDEVKEGNEVSVDEMILPHMLCVKAMFPDIDSIFITKQVAIHGCMYREGCILIMSYDEDHFPKFAYVVHILICDQKKYFLTQNTYIVKFDRHTLSYLLDFDDEFSIVNYHDLFIKFPLDVHLVNGKVCVINRYAYLSMDVD